MPWARHSRSRCPRPSTPSATIRARREHLCQPPARHAADGVPAGGRRVLVQPASVSGHELLHAAAQPGERGRRAAAWRARPAARAPVAGAREEGGHAGGA
ncbi:hypothetical protein FGB62_39g13 [Gracilaria domingensis]|nr:hypothetical protein FGB62_39g13 [Gracilaria domingensis]